MKTAEDHDVGVVDLVEYGVRKPAKEHPPGFLFDGLVVQRGTAKDGGRRPECPEELAAEATLLGFVPVSGLGDPLSRPLVR